MVEKIAEWYKASGWRIVREIELVFAQRFRCGGMAALFITGIVMSSRSSEFWIFLLFLLFAVINYFIFGIVCGFIEGEIRFFQALVSDNRIQNERLVKTEPLFVKYVAVCGGGNVRDS